MKILFLLLASVVVGCSKPSSPTNCTESADCLDGAAHEHSDASTSSDAAVAECEYRGERLAVGSEALVGDGCNTCVCDSLTGRVTCSSKDCALELACEPRGRVVPLGSTVYDETHCALCTCGEGGVLVCDARYCDAAFDCEYEGRVFSDGAVVSAPDGCNTWQCIAGAGRATDEPCEPLRQISPCDSEARDSVDTSYVLYLSGDVLAVEVSYRGCPVNPDDWNICYEMHESTSTPRARVRVWKPVSVGACAATPNIEQLVFSLKNLRDKAMMAKTEEVNLELRTDKILYIF